MTVLHNKPKTQEEFLKEYPDKSDEINSAFKEMDNVACSSCQKYVILNKLYISLGIKNIPDSLSFSFSHEDIPNYIIAKIAHIENAKSPRPPCEDCFKEHIAKAIILIGESQLGHPEHRWLAIGNLAEASAEIFGEDAKLAAEVRQVKLQMIQDKTFVPDLMIYL